MPLSAITRPLPADGRQWHTICHKVLHPARIMVGTHRHPPPPVAGCTAYFSSRHIYGASSGIMDAPNNNNEERREPVSRPLSPVFLDSHAHGWVEPPLSDYHQPQFPPSLYDIPIREVSLHTRPIQPFRRFNYLESQGEDLGSRQYTLGPDNIWEVNETYTNAYRRSAQNASHLPQFTSTCEPSNTWSLPPAVVSRPPTVSTPIHDPPPSHITRAPEPTTPVASGSNLTLEMLPPSSPNNSRSSPETPITPGPDSGPTRRRRGSSTSKKTCVPCNKSFYRKAEYDRHMKTASVHRTERQFKCRYCGEGLTRADAKVRHEKMCPHNSDSEGSQKGKGKGRRNGKEKEKDGSSD
ncbi:unnamed protein product [Rhizoctonia solani]|uniref:C2H2-type domain-containing protein n=1 Tax=Rhizoctonia solani TaxID=456999 RepID=A0A8H3GVN0_9AGAM|nr:unnamed protein product [Rhizoctonia solani]